MSFGWLSLPWAFLLLFLLMCCCICVCNVLTSIGIVFVMLDTLFCLPILLGLLGPAPPPHFASWDARLADLPLLSFHLAIEFMRTGEDHPPHRPHKVKLFLLRHLDFGMGHGNA